MDDSSSSASGDRDGTLRPGHSWYEKMSAVKENGLRAAKQMREQNKRFELGILAPREMKGGDTIPLSAVFIPLDWKIATRLEMVESAKDMITNAYMLNSLDPAFPTVLRVDH